MTDFGKNKSQLEQKGYSLVENIYTPEEIKTIVSIIEAKNIIFNEKIPFFTILDC